MNAESEARLWLITGGIKKLPGKSRAAGLKFVQETDAKPTAPDRRAKRSSTRVTSRDHFALRGDLGPFVHGVLEVAALSLLNRSLMAEPVTDPVREKVLRLRAAIDAFAKDETMPEHTRRNELDEIAEYVDAWAARLHDRCHEGA